MRNTCSVEECDQPVVGRGLCRRHYSRAYRGRDVGGAEKQKPGRPISYCSEDGCERRCEVDGLCRLHWDRSMAASRAAARREARAGRICARCAMPIPLERNLKAIYCSPECKREEMNERSSAKPENAERLRAYLYGKNFGITISDYDRMFEEQGGRCAICSTTEPGGRGRFHVDHCHDSGRVRGLLCTNCNMGLGRFRDDSDLLRAAIEYLARTSLNEVVASA